MKIGVVMPCFNQAEFLPAALRSYEAQVGAPPSRLVAVNDASTDATGGILASWGVDVVTHATNRGSAAAINSGVEGLGDGFDALTWISSDNVMTPDWLATLAVALERGAGAAYAGFWYERGKTRQYLFTPYDPRKLIDSPKNCFFGPAFLIRRDVWLEAGPHLGRISHDYGHWLRVEEACWRRGLPIVAVDKPLCHYNAHDARATVVRRHEFDADAWRLEALKRRSTVTPS